MSRQTATPPHEYGALLASTVNSSTLWEQITEDFGGSLLQSWRWGQFKSGHGWEPIRLQLMSNGTPVIAAQILFRSMGPFSLAYVPRGPMGDPDLAHMTSFTVALDRIARERRAVGALIEPDSCELAARWSGSLEWGPSAAVLQPERTIKVRVDQTDDDILAQMKSKTRYNVRLAGRRGVKVRRGTLSDIDMFYRLFLETAERDEFGAHRIEYFADMLRAFGEDAALLMAEHEGEAAAAVLLLRQGPETIYMYGASSAKHQRHMPAYLLQFEAMRWARDAGSTLYDLWGGVPQGVGSTDTPAEEESESGKQSINVRDGMWGIYRFKQGFGGDIIDYPGVFERVYNRPLLRLGRLLRPGLL